VTVTSHPLDNFQKRTFTGTNQLTVINSDIHLFNGSPANNDVTTPFQSTAYSYAPADAGTVIVSVTSSAPDVTPRVSVLPTTGAWADAMPPVTSVPLTPVQGESYYLVVFESTGAIGFSYTLSALSVPHVPEEEPNDTPGMAKPLMVPEEADAQLSSLTDVDFYKVSIADADVGKRLHVMTLPGDSMTNLAVEVLLPDGITSFTGVQDHSNYEDVLTNPLPMAGTYYVKITMSTQVISYDAAQSHYEVLVTLE
jgi:hypothetical protein